ncbi:MAG: menaquinone-dependent protoporphyrinogen IX dehydrogenase [Betaproteobacteria bacterium]
MANILILYSTTDGHTRKIAERIREVIEEGPHHVTLLHIVEAAAVDLHSFDQIVIGASIRYGRHSCEVIDFIRGNAQLLASKDNAFFSVNIVARKPAKNQPATNPYLIKFLRRIAWRPHLLAVFAGKLDYPRYGVLDRTMIRFIMWMTGGPTDPATVKEFTDWRQVEQFGERLRDGEPVLPPAG